MSSGTASGIFPLEKAQLEAVAPDRHVWLSASAGTGKTQVLSARVLRLLLTPGVRPENILCLTFTKAGATEMAARVQKVLAAWVRAPEVALAEESLAIGADPTPDVQERARRLFASVLDAPGGGLHIQTIHGFCQSLLAAFPLEAEIAPGFRPLEDREQAMLARQALIKLLLEAERHGDTGLVNALAELSMRKGDDKARVYLMQAAGAYDLWFGDDPWTGDIRPRLLSVLGLPISLSSDSLYENCRDDRIDRAAFETCGRVARGWSAKSGQELAAQVEHWLELSPRQRFEERADLVSKIATKDWRVRNLKSLEKQDAEYANHAQRAIANLKHIEDQKILLEYGEFASRALTIGRAFAFHYREAKQSHGYLDHDDQIRLVAQMLRSGSMAEWISYKLDQQFDHILIDESQDTNAAQWDIAHGLTSDYFSGSGAKADTARTIFTVGDYKQAIYGFQGTSPVNYEGARIAFKMRIKAGISELDEPQLNRNYRSSQDLLDTVDWTLEHLGHDKFGLGQAPPQHFGEERPGSVTIWRAVGMLDEEALAEDDPDDDESWLSKPERQLADNIAVQIKNWMDEGLVLEKTGEPVTPGDFMILVRSRKELASLIISRLYTKGVPVAGLDRLRLGQPLAVQDLLAAMSFAVQPHDELNLGNLLVSPLIGISQERLLELCWREPAENGNSRAPLWPHIRQLLAGTDELAKLQAILARSDFDTPYAFIEWVLSGPLKGRQRLVSRLGQEANDPIDELLATALKFQADHGTGLQKFLNWFGQNDEDIKRESGAGADLVRVLTVHGAKGLQAPIVILADATADPGKAKRQKFTITTGGNIEIPLPLPASAQLVGPLAERDEALKAGENEEHWRLLYVAMTRAEDRLFVTGTAQGAKRIVPDASWFRAVSDTMEGRTEAHWNDDPIWLSALHYGAPLRFGAGTERQNDPQCVELPDWARAPIAPEPRPPRPLAPSDQGEEDADYPPALRAGHGGNAARRGILLHALFERLPAVSPLERQQSGLNWLTGQAPELSVDERKGLVAAALSVIEDPAHAELFGPNSLAEVPVAALVGDTMMNGVIDRLVLRADSIQVVDFKSSRHIPETLDRIPRSYIRQMASYLAALRHIYPERTITAALLYTEGPRWFQLPGEMVSP